jgi:hypothetical protein
MSEQKQDQKAKVKLSRSGKGVVVFIDDQMWFTSRKSMMQVVNGEKPYLVLRQAQPRKSEDVEQKED